MTWSPGTLRRDTPLYLALADRIAEDVATERLRPGVRLPTQRQLAASLGVDLTTITRGYAEARRRGLLAARVGRGTYIAVASRAADTADGVIDLSLTVPPRLDPDLAATALANTLGGLARDVTLSPLLAYQDNAGMEVHRAAGAAWIGNRLPGASADRVVLTNGAQHAIYVLLSALTAPGDVVLSERLTFPGFLAATERLGVRVRGLEMDDDGITVDALRKGCRAGAKVLYVTPTLQNPTTITMSAERRAALARVATSHGVRVIEDDIYGMLAADAPRPLSAWMPTLAFFIGSLTKAVAGGMRLGYVHCPSHAEAERVAAAVRATTWMAAPLMAHVASEWVRTRVARDLVKANRAEATRRQAVVARVLRGWSWRADRSGYHGWLELPTGWTSAEFVAQARRRGVALTAADAFAAGGPAPLPAVRLCVTGPPDQETLERASDTVARLLELGPRSAARDM